jgi:hypothetical protein
MGDGGQLEDGRLWMGSKRGEEMADSRQEA